MKFIRRLLSKFVVNNFSFLRNLRSDLDSIKNTTETRVSQLESNVNILQNQVLEFIEIKNDPYYKLKSLLKLVEPYQPLFGVNVSGYSSKRSSRDRFIDINKYFDDNFSGMRILDVGSSLGYLSFWFASKGGIVTGWDYNQENVAVSKCLK
ncbi:MAG: hypothetical protein WCK31_01335 [bacterium]